MADATYQPKVYRKQGGDEQIVASGGTLTIESGGAVAFATGSKLTTPIIFATASKTLTAAQSGMTIVSRAANGVFTLPSTAAGLQYTFVLATAGMAATGHSIAISPAAADAIAGGGLTSVDNKDLRISATADAEGDTVTIVGDGSLGWYITSIRGTWAKEA